MFRKLMNVVFVLVLVLVFVMPVAAQELPVIPIATGTPVQNMADNLFSLLYNATYLPFAAGLVTILVSLSKRVSYLQSVSSPALVMFWTVMLWVLWTAANEIGYGSQFESVVGALTSLGGMVLGIAVTPMVAGRIYSEAKTQGVSVIGYQRAPVEVAASS